MSGDMFLDLDGIKGESTDAKHKDKIELITWNWGLRNTGTFHNGSGGGAGKASFKDIVLMKYVDKASTDLMFHCASGKHIAKGQIVVRKAAGLKPLEYLIFSFEKVLVTGVDTGQPMELNTATGSMTRVGGGEILVETVFLNFAKVVVEYKVQDEKGAGKDAGQFTWNIPANNK